MRFLVVALLVVGCKHKPTLSSVDPDFDAFEKKWVAEGDVLIAAAEKQGKRVTDADRRGIEAYHGIFIGKAGVIIDRKRVATLDELKAKRDQLRTAVDQNIAFVPTVNVSPMVVFDLSNQPASAAIDALALFVDKPISIEVEGPGGEELATQTLCPADSQHLRDASHGAVENLSVLVSTKSIWVGVSGINEYQEIVDIGAQRDLEKLKTALRERKMSEVFADRYDIELAADGGTAGDVIASLGIVCEDFTDIAILPPDRLSAKPTL
jgi:hypothetical protein